MVNMLWHGIKSDIFMPINYRIYDKDTHGKTNSSHFRDKLSSAKFRDIIPDFVVVDAWYSSLDNLKCIRSFGWNWVAGIR